MNNINERFNPRKLYNIFSVTLKVRDRVCGGLPKNPEMLRAHAESSTGFKDEITEKLIQENAELIVNAVEEKSWVGFAEDKEKGLFLQARNVKAMLKQSASLLNITKTKRGSKQILAEGLEVKAPDGTDRLYFHQDKPDGYEDKPIHVMTAQGPRTAIKRFDYVLAPTLTFEIWVLNTDPHESRHISEDDLVFMLTHGQENGLGGSRSQGEGKFDIVDFQLVSSATQKAKSLEPAAKPAAKAPKKNATAEA